MKKFKGFLLLFLTTIAFLLSSDLEGQSVWECGYDSANAEALILSPDYQQSQNNFNELWRSQMTPGGNNFNGGGSPLPRITIPVVVHVVYNSNDASNLALNISADQIRSQIAKLNEVFSNIGGPPKFDSEIRFCLASAPSTFFTNPSEPGIIRYPIDLSTNPPQGAIYNFPGGIGAGFTLRSLFPVGFIAENYLNIFIVYNFSTSANRAGQYIPMADIVVVRSGNFGDNGPNALPIPPIGGYPLMQFGELGYTAVHEVGHYLNLSHTFLDGCVGNNPPGSSTDDCLLNGDFICDTPPCIQANYICGQSIPNSCPEPGTAVFDLVDNYMYYAEECAHDNFTSDQIARMRLFLTTMRFDLVSNENLAATGVMGPNSCEPPIFFSDLFLTTDPVGCLPPAGSLTLDFASTSTLFPASSTATNLIWTITPAAFSSNTTLSGFQATINTAGMYTISLTSTDPMFGGAGTVTNTINVFVVNCGLPLRPEHAVWCYQNNVRLDFSSGLPVSTLPNSAIIGGNTNEFSSTSQSDAVTGNLLFYTNGLSVWNNNNALIGNISTALYGSPIKGTISVPNPNNFNFDLQTRTNSYFIFTVPAYGQSGNGSLVFGEVEINAGMATLISSNNTIPAGIFSTNVVEAITAVPHCNGRDTWIIVHEINSSNTISYLLTGNGISLAVQNNSAPFQNTNPSSVGSRFSIESAPSGDAIAIYNCADEIVYFYSFDNSDGTMQFQSSVQVPQGAGVNTLQGSFAPFITGGSYFYYAVGAATNTMYQIELPTLAAPNPIQNIPITLGSPQRRLTGSIQLGPDNYIYLSAFNIPNPPDSRMLVIRAPNIAGPGTTGCDPQLSNLSFSTGQRNRFSLPNLLDAERSTSLPFIFSAAATSCSTYNFNVNPCWSNYVVSWNFGDGTPISTGLNVNHTYSNNGQFQVSCTLTLGGAVLTFTPQTVSVLLSTPSITHPSDGCISANNPFEFSVPFFPGATYSWTTSLGTMTPDPSNPNVASPSWTTKGNYTVTVTVTSPNCSYTSTINFSSYYCCTTNIGNVLFNPTFNTGQISNQTFTINGTAVIDGGVQFTNCILKMGPEARIRVKPNSLLHIDQNTQISACDGEMWDGINIVDNTGRLTMDQSVIRDAVKAIEALNGANWIQCTRSEFTNNWVSIHLENGNYMASHFDENVFSSDASQMLVPHAGQIGRTGFQLRNIFANTYVKVGPSILNTSNGNLFQNLQYGIDSYNCSLISNNNNFLNIVEQTSPFSQTPWHGTGIFAENAPWSIGNSSTNTIEVYENFFNDCKRGVFVNKNSNVIIDSDNEFHNCSFAAVELRNLRQQNVTVRNCKVFDLGAFGFRFIDCFQMNNMTVTLNEISMPPTPPNPLGGTFNFSYLNTAMFFKNQSQLNSNALISYNKITDARIGISIQGYAQFSLSRNTIILNRVESDFIGLLHQGIEFVSSTLGTIDWNRITYTNGLNTTSLDYKDLFLGFNLRNISNSTIMHNTITRVGTAVRFIGNVTFNDILCNSMDDCALGWFFNNSQVSPIGIPGIPFENEFINFSNRARSDKDANASITDLYFPGDEVDLNNIYTAWPYASTLVISPYDNQPFQNICSGIATPDPTEDMSYMEKVILDSIQYPVLYEINRDRDLQSTYRRYRSSPDSSYAAYVNWFEQLENGRIGLTAKLIEAHINLDSIRILLDGLSDESNPIFNQLRELYEVVLYNLDHPDNPIPHDTSFLYQLAFMDEWNGTEAVYMARAILELEVNDFLLGLRTMPPISSADNMCDDLLKFYNSYIVIPVKSSPIQLEYFDKVGRLIFQEKTTEDLGAEKIKLLKTKAVFLIRAMQGKCIKVYKLP
ncbi:MAG: PKD domain-containing protein [Bacteroidetes bacterium]|nr:PKD domain-containing protein [Bacteroidota bacterium]